MQLDDAQGRRTRPGGPATSDMEGLSISFHPSIASTEGEGCTEESFS